MKKKTFITLFCCLTLAFVSAQEFAFGIKGGLNISSIGGEGTYIGASGLGSKVSIHLGGVAEIPISDKISIQPEVLYSSQGARWNFFGNNNLKLDYVNLPILGKYYIIEGLSVEAGPLLGVLLSTNADKEDFSTLDIAFSIGASYKLNENIFFSLRFNKGLTDINRNDDVVLSNQNNVLQLSAGYLF